MAISFDNFGEEGRVDFQERKCEEFSEKTGIPLVDIYAEANKFYDEDIGKALEGLESEEEIERAKNKLKAKSLMRGRGIFKRKANKLKALKKNGVSSFILFRFRDQDYNRNAWEKVDAHISDNNMSQEQAKKLGLMDDDGNYLFTELTTSFSDQHGKKIDKDYIIGSAVAFFEEEREDGTKNREARFIKIGYAGNKYVPICRPSRIAVKEGNDAGPMFPENKLYFYNDGVEEGSSMMVSLDFANYISELCNDLLDEDCFVNSYEEVEELGESFVENHDKWGYVGVRATCTSVGQFSDPTKNIPVEFEIYDETDTNTITTFVPPKHFEGMSLIEGASGLLILVNPFFDKEGNTKFHLGGFMPIMED